jgi:choline-glycine betaine transporter
MKRSVWALTGSGVAAANLWLGTYVAIHAGLLLASAPFAAAAFVVFVTLEETTRWRLLP